MSKTIKLSDRLKECQVCGKTYDKTLVREGDKCGSCVQKITKEETRKRRLRGNRSDAHTPAMGKEYVDFYVNIV